MSLLAASIQGLGLSFPGLPTEANMQFEELWRNTTEILYELDRISEQLHSSSLDLLGFTPAIQSLGRKIKSDSGVLVECRCANLDPGRLHDQFLPALFCIAEEALRNVAMHSRANIASLEVGQNSEEIVLRVSDDGVGFDRIKAEAGGGVGYIRIKESVRRIRGSLVVWSDPGHGTLVEVRAPAYDLHMAKV
jgi:signal transduction histidine kinase